MGRLLCVPTRFCDFIEDLLAIYELHNLVELVLEFVAEALDSANHIPVVKLLEDRELSFVRVYLFTIVISHNFDGKWCRKIV